MADHNKVKVIPDSQRRQVIREDKIEEGIFVFLMRSRIRVRKFEIMKENVSNFTIVLPMILPTPRAAVQVRNPALQICE